MPGSSDEVKVAFSVLVDEAEEEELTVVEEGAGVISGTEETDETDPRWLRDEGASGGPPPPAEVLRSRPILALGSIEFLLAPVWMASNDPLLAIVAATAACWFVWPLTERFLRAVASDSRRPDEEVVATLLAALRTLRVDLLASGRWT